MRFLVAPTAFLIVAAETLDDDLELTGAILDEVFFCFKDDLLAPTMCLTFVAGETLFDNVLELTDAIFDGVFFCFKDDARA